MRILVLSDLHLEHAVIDLSEAKADVVILAGDIHTKSHGVKWASQCFACPVLYVPGNHEYYGGNLHSIGRKLQEASEGTKVSILDNAAIAIQNTLFIGSTLWTDFNLYKDRKVYSQEAARMMLNDYRRIRIKDKGRYRLLTPKDTVRMFKLNVQFIEQQLKRTDVSNKVVITHHAPSSLSEAPAHLNSLLSPAFVSDLESLILKYQPKLWVHGHTHHSVDYMLGSTRIISNQRGYPSESDATFDPAFFVNIQTEI